MKSLLMAVVATLCFPMKSMAVEPIRIEIGQDYSSYSTEELRRRVWQLERAVAQLQEQVFQLALRGDAAPAQWTCQMQSFGKTLIANGNTRASALALVLKKCSDATNAVHCHESDVSCGNN